MSTSYLTQSLHRAIRQYPDRTATVFQDRRKSYKEFCDRVARLAGALQQLGMKPGDRVGILSLNSDRYLELYYAIWWGGGVVNPVNTRWSTREIAYSLDDCETRLLVVDNNFASHCSEISELSRSLHTLIFAGDSEAPAGMFDYETLVAEQKPVKDTMRSGDDLAGIFYTGGTTGKPKGVMLTHMNLYSSGMTGLVEGVAEAGDVGLHAAPMFHLADGMFLLVLTALGCTQVIVPAFQPELVLKTIQDEKVSSSLLVPTMIQMLVDDPSFPNFKLDSMRRFIYGASAINEALLERAMKQLPNAAFLQCYGQTEMSPIVSVLPPSFHSKEGGKLRSAGRPAASVEVRILDSEGVEVATDVVGEIAARGPGVMKGYWNNPEQTNATLNDGWVRTGDSAYMDKDGFIFVVDRVKDMIISGGENVYSAEVENAIAQHPSVASCAVIGIPDPQWGESVHAVVVVKKDAEAVDEQSIKAHCKALIAGYKCPRSVAFQDSLPLSGAGKILKTVLREPYWKDQARGIG